MYLQLPNGGVNADYFDVGRRAKVQPLPVQEMNMAIDHDWMALPYV